MVIFIVLIVFIKNLCENNGFCNAVKPSEETEILVFNQYKKSDRAPFSIYADLEFLIEKIDGSKKNPKVHLQQK